MKHYTDFAIVKETEKAYCFKDQDVSFWVPKAWFDADGFLKETRIDEFKYNRRFALEKSKFEATPFFMLVKETEKAYCLAVPIVLLDRDGAELAKEVWIPKSMAFNYDFVSKAIIEKMKGLKGSPKCSKLDIMKGIDYRADKL